MVSDPKPSEYISEPEGAEQNATTDLEITTNGCSCM